MAVHLCLSQLDLCHRQVSTVQLKGELALATPPDTALDGKVLPIHTTLHMHPRLLAVIVHHLGIGQTSAGAPLQGDAATSAFACLDSTARPCRL